VLVERFRNFAFFEEPHKVLEFTRKRSQRHFAVDSDKLNKPFTTLLNNVLVPCFALISLALWMNTYKNIFVLSSN
jgi:hypothetical protein